MVAPVLPRAQPPIRVVLVEGSKAQRAVLRRGLEADGDIVVVGEASSPAGAAAAVACGEPDVVALGVGVAGGEEAAIARIMRRAPKPILVLAGRQEGPRSERGKRAIGAGAAAVLARPPRWDAASEAALRRRIRALRRTATVAAASRRGERRAAATGAVLGLAASTGGPAAVEQVLRGLRGIDVPILLVQHIDHQLVGGLAEWLERSTGWPVIVGEHGAPLHSGTVTIGPGGHHLELGPRRRLVVSNQPRSLHMPSADRMLRSLAVHAGKSAVGAVLTGMGNDGAEGLLALKEAGGRTFAQDEASSAVFGMAKAALQGGAVTHVTPLASIPMALIRALTKAGVAS